MRLIVTGLAALALVACSSETKQETAITTPEAAAAPAEAVKSCEAPAAAQHGKKKMKKRKAKAAAKKEEVKAEEAKAEEPKAEEAKTEEKTEEKK